MHPGQQLEVLIGGLGLGYTAREALVSDRVRRVEVIELLPQVIGWLRDDLIPLAGQLNADPRLQVTRSDVYAQLAAPPDSQRDLILIDVDHSPDEHLGSTNGAFYTRDGLTAARRHLRADGVLAVWSYAEHSSFADALRSVFREVRAEPITVWNDLVDEEQTDWLFLRARLSPAHAGPALCARDVQPQRARYSADARSSGSRLEVRSKVRLASSRSPR